MKILHSQEELQAITSTQTVNEHMEDIIATYVFADDPGLKQTTKDLIHTTAKEQSIIPSSIFPFYKAIGEKRFVPTFTVPAINIRTLTFDTATLLFSLMKTHSIGPLLFEIAKSEMGYSHQRPEEYATVVLAGAIKAGYKGPVFIQGDHFQLNLKNFTDDSEKEIASLESLIDEAIQAQFYNLDIDASTLVDLEKKELSDQQKNNIEVTARLTQHIIQKNPEGMRINIGGEIGHIGGINSTVSDFEAFMEGYLTKVAGYGISKVSVQTGSSHGGTPLPDGTVQKVAIDFSVLKNIGSVAREKYNLAGSVQHGASTLPVELFDEFPQNNTVEIHLATGFQNTVFDNLPETLKDDMYRWVEENCKNEWKEEYNKEQFLYKTRKKALGEFKKQLWMMAEADKTRVLDALRTQFEDIFSRLHIYNTREILDQYVQ